MIQNEICQEQVALVRFNIFSGQCPFGADNLHAAKEINMDVLRIVFGGFCCCQQGLLLFDFVELQHHCIGSDKQKDWVICVASRIVYSDESLIILLENGAASSVVTPYSRKKAASSG